MRSNNLQQTLVNKIGRWLLATKLLHDLKIRTVLLTFRSFGSTDSCMDGEKTQERKTTEIPFAICETLILTSSRPEPLGGFKYSINLQMPGALMPSMSAQA